MSTVWLAADIAKATRLPRSGWLLMIQCFFDDSGTHAGAPIVVWGGVIGTCEQFAVMEERWIELLKQPLPGKPPLKKFRLTDCHAIAGEFKGYTRTECDVVQNLFRTAIVESDLIPVAYGVDTAIWDARVVGRLRELFDPESAVFGTCARLALEVAEENNQKVSVVFDEGRENEKLHRLCIASRELLPRGAALTDATFSKVIQSPGLQAADVVANYFYRYAQQWQINRNADPSCHFQHLLVNSAQKHYGMFSESEIDHIVINVTARLRARGVAI